MRIKPIINNTSEAINRFYVSPTNDANLLDKRIRELLPKFSENSADYALIDTYRDKNGKIKIHTVGFFDERIHNLDIVE